MIYTMEAKILRKIIRSISPSEVLSHGKHLTNTFIQKKEVHFYVSEVNKSQYRAKILRISFIYYVLELLGFPSSSAGKESACNAGDLSSIPGLGRSPGGGHGNLLQYPCLENPHGQRSLEGYSPWGWKELDTTERLSSSSFSS